MKMIKSDGQDGYTGFKLQSCCLNFDSINENQRENNMDFMKIWKSSTTIKTKDFILKE